jgi:hypothetical protein
MIFRQDSIEQCRLTGTQKARNNCHWNHVFHGNSFPLETKKKVISEKDLLLTFKGGFYTSNRAFMQWCR